MKKQIIRLAAALFTLQFVLAGCGPIFPGTATVSEIEPNNTFSTAQSVSVSASESLAISGSLNSDSDVDVFLLGTFQQGQTLTADLKGGNALIASNVSAAFFDENQDVAILDKNAVTSVSDETVSVIVRKPGTYYLALSQTNRNLFSYTVAVTVGSAAIPAPQKQMVFLDYNGIANVQIGQNQFTDVLPFSAVGANAATLAGQITDKIRADYAHLDIQILSSYETAEPQDPHSTVYVSGGSADFFGLADQVDWYNHSQTDRAIIFAGTNPFNLSTLPQNEFVSGVANVTAHELGHLVGLAHTNDHTEIMDQVTPDPLLVLDQTFHRAPLAEFPIGWEDTLQLLQFALGIVN